MVAPVHGGRRDGVPGARRRCACRRRSSGWREPPAGFVEAPAPTPRTTAIFRRRETGTYGEAPYVEEWKPLPPRLHDLVEVPRDTVAARALRRSRGSRWRAPGGVPLTGLTLAEARPTPRAPARGCRPRTSGSWPPRRVCSSAASRSSGTGRRASTHDGVTRFAILKGGAEWKAEGSDWYVDGGEQEPAFSLKLLLAGPLQASPNIGFRLAVDLP